MYGSLLVELGSRGREGAALAERIKGFIFDSPVDLAGVPFGLSRAVVGAEGNAPQRLLEAGLALYLSEGLPMRQHYQASSDAMHGTRFSEAGFSSPLALPSAFIYSDADTVTNSDDIRVVCDKWRAAGCDMEEALFDGTAHVSHLPSAPDKYEGAVARVIAKALPGL